MPATLLKSLNCLNLYYYITFFILRQDVTLEYLVLQVGFVYCILQYSVAFLSELAYDLSRNILLLFTATEKVLSFLITNNL